MIEANQLSFAYEGSQSAVIDGLDLTLKAGEFLSVVGRSGCGKTTLLRLLAGLLRPSTGFVTLNGDNPQAQQAVGNLGYMWQSDSLLPWLTVEENVELPFAIQQMSARKNEQVVHEVLNAVGLGDVKRSYPNQLSGGMRQRVCFARCLATEPKILFMDEPFSSLDEVTRDKLLELVSRRAKSLRMTTVMVTHNLRDAIRISDRVDVLSSASAKIVNSFSIRSDLVGTERALARESLHREIVGCL